MRNFKFLGILVSLMGAMSYVSNSHAQAAGAGADFNRAERAYIQEQQRLERVDPPIRPDPVGNALIGGAVTGALTGAAAGAASAVRGAAIGSAVQEIKADIQQRRVENQESGRGGANDPRYDPSTLFDR